MRACVATILEGRQPLRGGGACHCGTFKLSREVLVYTREERNFRLMNKMTSVLLHIKKNFDTRATLPRLRSTGRYSSYEHARASPPHCFYSNHIRSKYTDPHARRPRARVVEPREARGRQATTARKSGSSREWQRPRQTDTPGGHPAPTRTRSKYIRKASMRSCVRAALRPQTSATTRRLKTNARDGSTPMQSASCSGAPQSVAIGGARRRLCPYMRHRPPSRPSSRSLSTSSSRPLSR